MRVVQLSRFGGPEVLEVLERKLPAIGPGEVLIRVHAAGVNYFEVLMRQDRYAVTPELPLLMGVEVAGVVEAVGGDVSQEAVGKRVAVPLFALGRAGGYADYVSAAEHEICPLPDDLSFEDATALQVQGLTALHMIRRSSPRGKTVLITAAAGGVGSLLVQLARSSGASRVVAAASNKEKRQLALSLGADAVVDYSDGGWIQGVREATGGRGVDVLFDLVGGDLTKGCLEALAPGGELVFGALGRVALGRADLEDLFARNQSIRGFALLPLLTKAGIKAELAWLFDEAIRGRLKVLPVSRYPLDRVADAHRAFERRATTGKVVLVP
jgi:NADPH:quinone reductase